MNLFFPEQTSTLIAFNVIILLLVYLSCKSVMNAPFYLEKSKCRWIALSLLLFSLFSFYNTDWFHYQTLYEPLKLDYVTHLEPIYYFIAQKLSFDYISFRLIVWGGGLVLILRIMKNLPISYGLSLFLFAMISLPKYSYSRVSLAMALVFYGLMLYYKNDKLRNKLIGILLIGCSFYLHKTAVFGILASAMVIITEKLNRKAMLLLFVVSVPLLVYLMSSELGAYLSMDVDYEAGGFEQTLAAGQKHMERDTSVAGMGYVLQTFAERLTYCLAAVMSFLCIRKSEELRIPDMMVAFMKAHLIIVVISMLFLVDFGVNMSVIHIRFIRFAVIPTSLIIAYSYENKLFPKVTKCALGVGLLTTTYLLLYSLYNSFF